MPYGEARRCLTKLPGVGNKVADCILLFSVGFLEAVPLDRWMARIMHQYYGIGAGLAPTANGTYDRMHQQAVNRLGPYAGYAQQYLFKTARDGSSKPLKW